MSCALSLMIRAKRIGSQVIRRLQCEIEAFIGDLVHRLRRNAISKQEDAALQCGVYQIVFCERRSGRRKKTHKKKVITSSIRGALTTMEWVDPWRMG